MSASWRTYHWTNALAIPGLAGLAALTQGGVFLGILGGWVLISAIIDERLRGWVVASGGAIFGTGAIGGCLVASLAGLVLFLVIAIVVALAITVGAVLAAIYLWGNSVYMLIAYR